MWGRTGLGHSFFFVLTKATTPAADVAETEPMRRREESRMAVYYKSVPAAVEFRYSVGTDGGELKEGV